MCSWVRSSKTWIRNSARWKRSSLAKEGQWNNATNLPTILPVVEQSKRDGISLAKGNVSLAVTATCRHLLCTIFKSFFRTLVVEDCMSSEAIQRERERESSCLWPTMFETLTSRNFQCLAQSYTVTSVAPTDNSLVRFQCLCARLLLLELPNELLTESESPWRLWSSLRLITSKR